jgi:hypothetical protein
VQGFDLPTVTVQGGLHFAADSTGGAENQGGLGLGSSLHLQFVADALAAGLTAYCSGS